MVPPGADPCDAPESAVTNAEPSAVAWRVRDLGDGWILMLDPHAANGYAADGHLVEPLYARPAEPSARRRLSSLEALLADALAELAAYGCPACSGDCASACPPINACPMRYASDALAMATSPQGARAPLNVGDEVPGMPS